MTVEIDVNSIGLMTPPLPPEEEAPITVSASVDGVSFAGGVIIYQPPMQSLNVTSLGASERSWLASVTEITLSRVDWEFFAHAADQAPSPVPAVRRILTEPSVLDR